MFGLRVCGWEFGDNGYMVADNNGDESRFTLTRVWARNFKSIRELDLELGPLTVLVGPNASGKSNVLDVLRFIKETVGRGLDSAVTSRHGFDAIVAAHPQGDFPLMEVGFEIKRGEFGIEYGFVIGSEEGAVHVEREYATVTPGMGELKPIHVELGNGAVFEPSGYEEEEFDESDLAFESWAHLFVRFPDESSVHRRRLERITNQQVKEGFSFVRRMKFYRLFPDAMREPRQLMNPSVLNEDGRNLASVLRDMDKGNSRFLGEIKANLKLVVPNLSDMLIAQSGGYLIVKLQHEFAENGVPSSWLDLSQESDGTVRLLGLLTAFYQDNPNSLVGVEEPELTVHPGALAVLTEVMEEASHRTQVLATTHSPDLIDRLPIGSLRAVQMRDGSTIVGPVADHQRKSVVEGLFTTGELHSMEGLEPRG